MSAPALVVIGGSAGMLEALSRLLPALPATVSAAIVLVSHRSPESRSLGEVLQGFTSVPVVEVEDKERIAGGRIYLAPADYHLLVEADHFTLSTDEPVQHSRPSIDVTMESAADAWGRSVLGVVLTGANHDGAAGLRRIADRGGMALVQEPEEAEIAVMPAAALEAVPDARVLPIAGMVEHLVAWGAPRRKAGA